MIHGAVQITPTSVRHSAISTETPEGRSLTAGLREIPVERVAFGEVEAALTEGVEAVREAGADRVQLLASGDLRGTAIGGRLSVKSRRLGLGELRFTGTGAAIAAEFVSRSVATGIGGGLRVSEACGVLGIGYHSVGLAVGSPGLVPTWTGSRPIGVKLLGERSRISDPPEPTQLAAAQAAVERSLGGLTNPGFDLLIAVSDFARATRLICGELTGAESLGLALDSVLGMSADELGARAGLGSVLARLFPLALTIQYAAARTFAVDLAPVDPDPADLDFALTGSVRPGA